MRCGTTALALVAVLALLGCGDDPFVCTTNADCGQREGGLCGPAGYCAFPDATCPSTLRYSEHAGDLSGLCVPLDPDSDTLADTFGASTESATGDAEASGGPWMTATADSGASADGSDTMSTMPGDCNPAGAQCQADSDCCGGCLLCQDGACMADTGASAACGPCQACDATGQCAIDEGAPCDGPTIDCTQILYGLSDGDCLAADGVATPQCNALGECRPADAADCDQPGAAVVSCSDVCIDNAAACASGQAVDSISVESMCVTNQETAGCSDECKYRDSVAAYYFYDNWCGGAGTCMARTSSECYPYGCDQAGCFTSCESDEDCLPGECDTTSGECV